MLKKSGETREHPHYQPTQMPVRQATPEDCTPLFHLINGSYHRETGDNAPAFKKSLRFLSPAELLSHPSYTSNCCLVAEGPSGALLGVLCYEIQNHDGILRAHFGPFAVDEAHQGKGVGKELIDALLEKAKLAGCASIDAEVVNHRLDLFPMCEFACVCFFSSSQPFPRGPPLLTHWPPLTSLFEQSHTSGFFYRPWHTRL